MKLFLVILLLIPFFANTQTVEEISSEELKELILKEKSVSLFVPKFSKEHKKIGLKYLKEIEDSELGYATNLIVYLDPRRYTKNIQKEILNTNKISKKISYSGSIYFISEQVNSKYYSELLNVDCNENSYPMSVVNNQNATFIYSGIDDTFEKYLSRIKLK